MMMPGRKFTLGDYRYGFNGKDSDTETSTQDYGFRVYNAKLGRFLSVDPLMPDYPFYAPYQFAGNKPVIAADLDGLEEWMKSQELALKRSTQLIIQKASLNKASVRQFNPGDQSWVQKWRDSKNFIAQFAYNYANGLYTFPQQLASGLTQQEYIENIGGTTYKSKGSGSETQRIGNFVNGATSLVPSAPGLQSVKALGLADDVMRFAAVSGDDILKSSEKGISVIGPRANYREFARKIGANFLDVTDQAWSARKNVKFLQDVIKRGDNVLFAGKYDPKKLDPSSILAQEIRFLEKYGYKWTEDLARLVKAK